MLVRPILKTGIYGFALAVIPRIPLLLDKECERLISLAIALSGGKIGLFSGNNGFFGSSQINLAARRSGVRVPYPPLECCEN